MNPVLLRDYCGQSVKGWLLSEKLDGWRLMWDGKNYVTRQGLILQCPDSWYVGMPDHALDGELFAGRGHFNSIQHRIKHGFDGLTFHVFDVIDHRSAFSVRAKFLANMDLPSHCVKVSHRKVSTVEEMIEIANSIVDDGGEGVVVRNPKWKYSGGRSWDVLRHVPQCPTLNRV